MGQNEVYRADGSCMNLGGQTIYMYLCLLVKKVLTNSLLSQNIVGKCQPCPPASIGQCLNSVPPTIRHILLNFEFLMDTMLEIDILSPMYKLQILKCFFMQVLPDSHMLYARLEYAIDFILF